MRACVCAERIGGWRFLPVEKPNPWLRRSESASAKKSSDLHFFSTVFIECKFLTLQFDLDGCTETVHYPEFGDVPIRRKRFIGYAFARKSVDLHKCDLLTPLKFSLGIHARPFFAAVLELH